MELTDSVTIFIGNLRLVHHTVERAKANWCYVGRTIVQLFQNLADIDLAELLDRGNWTVPRFTLGRRGGQDEIDVICQVARKRILCGR